MVKLPKVGVEEYSVHKPVTLIYIAFVISSLMHYDDGLALRQITECRWRASFVSLFKLFQPQI